MTVEMHDETGEAVGSQVSERIQRAREIAESAEKRRSEEDGFEIDYTDDEVNPPEDVSEQSLDTQDNKVENKHKIKVNGKELELSYEELVARAQKVEAADQYLAEAAKLAKTPPPVKDVEPEDNFDDEIAIVRAIQMGDEQEAVQAIRKLKAGLSNQDDTAKLIDDRLAGKRAADRFKEEYKDIVEDPILFQIAMNKDNELLQKGDTRDYWDRYQEIGNAIREWDKSRHGKTSMEEKQARKADIVSLTPASRKSAAPVEEDGEEDPQSIIRAMAKKRGQI